MPDRDHHEVAFVVYLAHVPENLAELDVGHLLRERRQGLVDGPPRLAEVLQQRPRVRLRDARPAVLESVEDVLVALRQHARVHVHVWDGRCGQHAVDAARHELHRITADGVQALHASDTEVGEAELDILRALDERGDSAEFLPTHHALRLIHHVTDRLGHVALVVPQRLFGVFHVHALHRGWEAATEFHLECLVGEFLGVLWAQMRL